MRLLPILLLLLAACGKDKDHDTNIEGNWKMIEVRENSSGIRDTKPANAESDVEMNLSYDPGQRKNGDVSGHTLTNSFFDGSFSTPDDHQITIGAFSSTDAMETPWGRAFLDNIFSATEYDFDSKGRLLIDNGEKTLVFEKK